MSQRASVTSIPTMWFMGTSRGYAAVLNLASPPYILTSGQPNILIDDSGHARITEFGLARVTRSVSHQNVHTARWTAPEVLNEGPHSKESDVFSFAMVMIEVCRG